MKGFGWKDTKQPASPSENKGTKGREKEKKKDKRNKGEVRFLTPA